MRTRALLILILAGCGNDGASPPVDGMPPEAPRVHIRTGTDFEDFDQGYCRRSMIPVQDPVFPTIRRDAFAADATTDLVTIPPAWLAEARDVVGPRLKQAAATRVPVLLGKVEELVRPFEQRDFSYFFYLCPYFEGGTASAKVFPMFQYLTAAVGDLAWPDWLFTDQYIFHESLHDYVLERVDYRVGTPILNTLYGVLVADPAFEAASKAYLHYTGAETAEQWARDQATMVGTALTHVHVYALMTVALRALGDEERLQTIRTYETTLASAHPSYVAAWQYVIAIENDPVAMKAVLDEIR